MTIAIQPSTPTRRLASTSDQFQALRSRLAGELITAASAEFDRARKLRFISIARVQAGATSGDLADPAHAHGLALSTGDTHSVGGEHLMSSKIWD